MCVYRQMFEPVNGKRREEAASNVVQQIWRRANQGCLAQP